MASERDLTPCSSRRRRLAAFSPTRHVSRRLSLRQSRDRGECNPRAWNTGVEKLLFLGSSCIYPELAPQPMTEEMLLTGPLEPTNEWYAVAKIAGIKLCQAYRQPIRLRLHRAMPTNLYGPGDNYDPQSSHVAAALQVKVHEAKRANAPTIEIWGTGTPRREFLYVDDLADALVFMLKHYSGEPHLNVGTGTRHYDPRACGTGGQSGWVARAVRLRPLQARRHAAQGNGRLEARRARLEGADAARRRVPERVCLVPSNVAPGTTTVPATR